MSPLESASVALRATSSLGWATLSPFVVNRGRLERYRESRTWATGNLAAGPRAGADRSDIMAVDRGGRGGDERAPPVVGQLSRRRPAVARPISREVSLLDPGRSRPPPPQRPGHRLLATRRPDGEDPFLPRAAQAG